MKILVIGPSWVGDMVMAQSLFIMLQRRHPGCRLDVLAPAWTRDLLTRMPEVNAAIPMTVGHGELGIGKRRAIAAGLKQTGYDQAIVLPNSFKSALIPWFAGIPTRTGWRGEARSWLLNDCRVLDKQAYPLMVERFIALALAPGEPLPDPLPYPRLDVSEAARGEVALRLQLDLSRPVMVLCPGAEFGAAKKWPAGGYARVAADWIAGGGQAWIMGSANDRADAEAILQALQGEGRDRCVDLTGRTTLGDAIDLMACADRVVANDSGLMHVAAALARPLVVIYGSTSPDFTPPLANRVATVSLALACSPCFKRECPLGHTHCLTQLEPARVNQALKALDDS